MDILERMNYESGYFENLYFQYDGLEVEITGSIDVEKKKYYIQYDGNSVGGGYYQTEIENVNIDITDVLIYELDIDDTIQNEKLKTEIIEYLKSY